MKFKQIRIDISKNTFHVIAVDVDDGIVWRKQFSRSQLLDFLESKVRGIAFEAYSGAH